jgi:hypothetical protein
MGITVLMPADTTPIFPGFMIISSATMRSKQTDHMVFLSGNNSGNFEIIRIFMGKNKLNILKQLYSLDSYDVCDELAVE